MLCSFAKASLDQRFYLNIEAVLMRHIVTNRKGWGIAP
jgi:hypothetical protein